MNKMQAFLTITTFCFTFCYDALQNRGLTLNLINDSTANNLLSEEISLFSEELELDFLSQIVEQPVIILQENIFTPVSLNNFAIVNTDSQLSWQTSVNVAAEIVPDLKTSLKNVAQSLKSLNNINLSLNLNQNGTPAKVTILPQANYKNVDLDVYYYQTTRRAKPDPIDSKYSQLIEENSLKTLIPRNLNLQAFLPRNKPTVSDTPKGYELTPEDIVLNPSAINNVLPKVNLNPTALANLSNDLVKSPSISQNVIASLPKYEVPRIYTPPKSQFEQKIEKQRQEMLEIKNRQQEKINTELKRTLKIMEKQRELAEKKIKV